MSTETGEVHSALHVRVSDLRGVSKSDTVERALRRELGLPADGRPDGRLAEIEDRLERLERLAAREGAV